MPCLLALEHLALDPAGSVPRRLVLTNGVTAAAIITVTDLFSQESIWANDRPNTKEHKTPDLFFKMTQLDEDVMTIVKFDDYAHQTLQANHLFGNLVNHISGYIQGSNDFDYSEHFTLQKVI
uniref:Uncharacterized protein n=1 Tax=Oryza barthii TaxID=65489 RepID=A0A0D3HKW6_9ORYZ